MAATSDTSTTPPATDTPTTDAVVDADIHATAPDGSAPGIANAVLDGGAPPPSDTPATAIPGDPGLVTTGTEAIVTGDAAPGANTP